MFACFCIPQRDDIGKTTPPTDDCFAVWTERHAPKRIRLLIEGAFVFSRFSIPQADASVRAPSGDCLAIGTECCLGVVTRVFIERIHVSACFGIPQTNSLVKPYSDEGFAIRTEHHTVDIICMFEGVFVFSRFRIPQTDSLVPGSDLRLYCHPD